MRAVLERAERRLEHAGAAVHEEHLVAGRVAEEIAHRFGDDRGRQHDVVVADQRDARFDDVAGFRDAAGEPVPVAHRVVRQKAHDRALPRLHVERRGRRAKVVRERVDALEPFGRHQLFGVQRTARRPKLCVPFLRQAPLANVECQRSSSARALPCRPPLGPPALGKRCVSGRHYTRVEPAPRIGAGREDLLCASHHGRCELSAPSP